ncbi:MAG: hypothetical protein QNK05_19690 [Myxococcota bacterium]|nr:hypothetical protein [Myxococcota bacterium]
MKSYESLLREIFPRLYAVAYAELGDEEAAALAAQHAFLQAFEASGGAFSGV